MIIRTAAYLRISDVGEDENDPEGSIERQREIVMAKAKVLGLTLRPEDIYEDRFTGTDFVHRPDFNRLKDAVKSGRYDRLILWKLDRLGRKFAYQAVTYDEFTAKGCVVISATEDLGDPKSSTGKLLRQTLGIFGEFERDLIYERTQVAKARLVDKGLPMCGGKARLGYVYDKANRRRVEVPSESALVLRIFTLASEGNSSQSIAMTFNAEGIPSPGELRGKKFKTKPKWRHDTILDILRDRSYLGEPMMQGRYKLVGEVLKTGRRKPIENPESEWKPTNDRSPQLITEDLWRSAHQVVAQGRGVIKTRNKTHPVLLRGITYCGVCGKKMTASYGTYSEGKPKHYFACTSKYRAYRTAEERKGCGNRLTPTPWADEEGWRLFVAQFTTPDMARFDRHWEEKHGDTAELERYQVSHTQAIAKAQESIGSLLGAFAGETNAIVKGALKAQVDKMSQEAESHRVALEEIEGRLRDVLSKAEARAKVLELGSVVRALGGRELTFDEKRSLLESFGIEFVATGKALEIRVVIAGVSTSRCHRYYTIYV